MTIPEIIMAYGPIASSLGSFFYLLSVKVNNISNMEKSLIKIETKIETICERQIHHEGRVSKIEGVIHGRHKTV